MSAHTEFVLGVITEQGPLEKRKSKIYLEIDKLQDTDDRGTRLINRTRVRELSKELISITKRLNTLNKALALATKKAMEEMDGSVYKLSIADVHEVGGTEDDLDELTAMLSGLMKGGRRTSRTKTRKSKKSRKHRN
jgi:hypothetical protein